MIVREGFESLDAAEEKEDDLLDKAWGLELTSRLSCQAKVKDADLTIEIPKYTINHAKEGTMKWTDSLEIAIALADKHPDVDPSALSFIDLLRWVLALDGFDDDPKRSGEKILEAIQLAWIDEAD